MENEHMHSHTHEHTHEHSHIHTHEHTHSTSDHTHTPGEIKALLNFMIQHNDHHNEELADLLSSLPAPAQKQMLTAIGAFEAANAYLQGVLEYLD